MLIDLNYVTITVPLICSDTPVKHTANSTVLYKVLPMNSPLVQTKP